MEDETNHDTFMINKETYFEPEVETTATPLEELATLLNRGGEEILPPSHLGPHGSNIVMGERSSLEGIQEAAFQTSMEYKGEDMAWENGDPHERKTNGEKRRRHPQGVDGCG